MGTQAASVQQQVIEKTKSTLQKTQTLMINMEKRLSSTKTFQEPFAVCVYEIAGNCFSNLKAKLC